MKKVQLLKPAVFSLGLFMSLVSQAQAGFEWKGPVAAPAPRTAPPAAAGVEGLEPVITWDGATGEQKSIQWNQEVHMPAEKVEAVEKADVSPAPSVVPATLTPAEEAALPAEVISGFGSDLPLVIALQQVVPVGHQYAFSSGVNPGVSVSWEGGKSWKEVLSDMLAKQGLSYRLNNNVVIVGHFAAPVEASVSTPPLSDRQPAPIAITAAPEKASAAVPAAEPVYIRRQKPSSLLKKSGVDVVEAQTDVAKPTEVTAPEPAAALEPSWQGAKGQTVRDVLKSWSDVAGVELYWSIDYDYLLTEDIGFPGTYDDAVGRLLDKFAASRPQPYGQLHQGSEGPRVLVIKSYDLTP